MLVVGATSEDSDGTGVNGDMNEKLAHSGAAYVFLRAGPTWLDQGFIKAQKPRTSDHFGTAVSVSGDGRIVAVGSPDEGSAGEGVTNRDDVDLMHDSSGVVYVIE